MFVGIGDAALPYEPPWNAGFEQRLAAVYTSRPCKAIWLYEQPDTSTFRYRVFNVVESLAADPKARIAAAWFTEREIPLIEDLVEAVDVVVVCRMRYSAALARLVARAKAAGARVLFDCDDLVFDTRYVHLIVESLDEDVSKAAIWETWFGWVGRIEASMRLCDGGIATNPYLAERLFDALGGKRVGVIPNFLNRQQQEASVALLETKQKSAWARDARVTIGYFSGSPSHNHDFEIAVPALARLLESNSRVDLRVVGFPGPMGALSAYAGRIELIPLQDFINLQRMIAAVEVNIVPLQDNTFTNCKSELKFFEAAAVGTWTVATPTSTYGAAISHGETGLLAHAHEWDDRLQKAVALAQNARDYAAAAERAARVAFSRYGWDLFSDCIVDALSLNPARASAAHS
jgi:glycosyltransferase involved in cell wall biosynthesis